MAKVKMCGDIGSATFNATMASLLDDPAAMLPDILGGKRPNRECLNLPRRFDVACSSTALASDWTCTLVISAGVSVVVDIPIINCDAWRAFREEEDGTALIVPPADVALSSGAIAAGAAGTTGRGGVAFEWRTSDAANDIEFSSRFTPSAEAASLARGGTARRAAPRASSAASAEPSVLCSSRSDGAAPPAAGAADEPTVGGAEGGGPDDGVGDERSALCHGVERSAAGSGTFDLGERDATFAAAVAGTLHLVFNNSFSWFRGKVVTLRVRKM